MARNVLSQARPYGHTHPSTDKYNGKPNQWMIALVRSNVHPRRDLTSSLSAFSSCLLSHFVSPSPSYRVSHSSHLPYQEVTDCFQAQINRVHSLKRRDLSECHLDLSSFLLVSCCHCCQVQWAFEWHTHSLSHSE